jgi:hypothetical protein
VKDFNSYQRDLVVKVRHVCLTWMLEAACETDLKVGVTGRHLNCASPAHTRGKTKARPATRGDLWWRAD